MDLAGHILKAIEHPLLVLDDDLCAVLANQSLYDLLHLPAEGLAGERIDELVKGDHCAPPLRVVLEAILEGRLEQGPVELDCLVAARSRRRLSLQAKKVPIGKREYLLVELKDVTRERERSKRIKVLNDAIRVRRRELEVINRDLESFVHFASHDLRTPVRAMHRTAQVLAASHGGSLGVDAKAMVQALIDTSQEMGRIIEDLLKLSSIGREPLRKRRVNMAKLFQDSLVTLAMEQERRNIQLEIGALPTAQGDRGMLKHVVNNILGNALKYTRRKRTAIITIGAERQDGRMVYFVRDNGVGLDMAEAGHLFEPFSRMRNAKAFEGSGVGMALAKRIIERHGGLIWADGAINRGATFYFSLE